MDQNTWQDLGAVERFQRQPLTEVIAGRSTIAISFVNGEFGAISGVCNHVGGPLGQGRLEGEYVTCPWHNWKFHRRSGVGEPGFEDDTVPSYEVKAENGHLFLRLEPLTQRRKKPHAPHPLSRPIQREEGPVRVAGISTTNLDRKNPRYSTSEALLQIALEHAQSDLGCATKFIRLYDLKFRNCEGYYSKSAQACTWPCSITQMDAQDEMAEVYETLVFWCDVLILATPIRWGQASALFFKMAERLNCVQNQVTIRDRVLLRNKVASFIITGGQDNVQGVAGHLLTFFSELGFYFPQFPFIAHSRGWAAEDMERNVVHVMNSEELRNGAKELAGRAVETAQLLLARDKIIERTPRGGRKAHRLEVMEQRV
ncbi:MAG: Rieske 2Fe-2S domain-containing protein [bacterium]